jgi:hypothetical protein
VQPHCRQVPGHRSRPRWWHGAGASSSPPDSSGSTSCRGAAAPDCSGCDIQSVCAKNCTKPPPPPPKPPPMVMCNNDTLKCEKVNSTTKGGQTGAACAAACIKKYLCAPNGNQSNLTCKEIGRSEPAYPSAQTLSACQSTCVEPPKHNGTPPVLQGTYRGIMISGGE